MDKSKNRAIDLENADMKFRGAFQGYSIFHYCTAFCFFLLSAPREKLNELRDCLLSLPCLRASVVLLVTGLAIR